MERRNITRPIGFCTTTIGRVSAAHTQYEGGHRAFTWELQGHCAFAIGSSATTRTVIGLLIVFEVIVTCIGIAETARVPRISTTAMTCTVANMALLGIVTRIAVFRWHTTGENLLQHLTVLINDRTVATPHTPRESKGAR